MTIYLNTQADLEAAIGALVAQDPRLAPILARAGMPALRRREAGFSGLAAIVCGQQVSTASAAAIWGRVSAAFTPFHHEPVRRARADRLGRLGLSAAKIKTLKGLAREIGCDRLDLDGLADADADTAHQRLTALHGIGPWTADIYLLFCLGHGDAWPAGTLATAARRRGASVVGLLQGGQEPRGGGPRPARWHDGDGNGRRRGANQEDRTTDTSNGPPLTFAKTTCGAIACPFQPEIKAVSMTAGSQRRGDGLGEKR